MTKHGIVMGFKESNVVQTMENNPPMTGNGKFIAPTKLQNGDDWAILQMALGITRDQCCERAQLPFVSVANR